MNILVPEHTRLKINEDQIKGERSEKIMSVASRWIGFPKNFTVRLPLTMRSVKSG